MSQNTPQRPGFVAELATSEKWLLQGPSFNKMNEVDPTTNT